MLEWSIYLGQGWDDTSLGEPLVRRKRLEEVDSLVEKDDRVGLGVVVDEARGLDGRDAGGVLAVGKE
jgi:D-serine deaminase-like pyridoxal phosphate-dependent protein